MQKNYFLMLGISTLLVACNHEEEIRKHQIKEFVSIEDCGKKFAQLTFLNMNGKIQTDPVFHGSKVTDESGNNITVPDIHSSSECKIDKLLKPKKLKL